MGAAARAVSARIPSVRVPVAALSGGQRQTVAIARSLIGEPSVVILDEPTAALGVAQTAEVLNLIERLRERGLGVILISHNIADVQAVADRIVVLRLGRNNGDFSVADITSEAHRRDHRRHRQRGDPQGGRRCGCCDETDRRTPACRRRPRRRSGAPRACAGEAEIITLPGVRRRDRDEGRE